MRLKNKIALVTGAASGIGKAIAPFERWRIAATAIRADSGVVRYSRF